MAKAKIKGKVKCVVTKKPLKAGSTHMGKNTGGIINLKAAAIARKRNDRLRKG